MSNQRGQLTHPQPTLEEIIEQYGRYKWENGARVHGGFPVMTEEEAQQAIRAWAVSQLPEKLSYLDLDSRELVDCHQWFNEAISQATQSLKEGK